MGKTSKKKSTPSEIQNVVMETKDNYLDNIESGFKKDKITVGDYSFDQDDLYAIGDAELDEKGLVHHHISSINDLYTNGIPQIITQGFMVNKDIANQRDSTPEDKLIDRVNIIIKFTDVFMSRPTMINYFSGKEEIIYPNMAILQDKTYSANLRVNASIKATAYYKNGTTKIRTDEIKNHKLTRVPVALKTNLCNTHDASKETLMHLNEDPNDPGGYFIINGVEWSIDCIENILFNQIRIFKNEGYSKEVMRVEYVSKPGDTYQNSDYFLIRLLNDNQLTCEIARNHLKGIQIPFYLVFRVLGWGSDKELFDNILYGYGNDISKNMLNYVIDSINTKYSNIPNGRHVYNQTDILKLIADEIKYTEFKYLDLDNKPENYAIAYNKIFGTLETNFLPHIGLTAKDRHNKLRYLALIIRKLFLVKMGNMETTDRDSYKSKRIHAAGVSYAKTFKTYFNASIIQQINRRLVKDFRSMSFSQVDLASSVKSSMYGADFERSIMQAITSGNKSQITINKKARINRLSSQLLDRKNQIALYSTLRQVTTTSTESSKQSERANEMRRVHMSFLGYICCVHSSTGGDVGINKQLAIFASILGASSSDVIKETLVKDPLLIPLDKATPDSIYENDLHNIYVNGDWIGCTKDCLKLVKKYRNMRRTFEINPLTTIYWDNTQDEAFFWVDVGRVVRPLIIVYNNKRDPEAFPNNTFDKTKKFKQGIAVTKSILEKLQNKTIDMEYLIKNNIVEYITSEEQENCYICPFFDQLRDDKDNELNEYTHCDIPQALLGITALTCPFANHNQSPRITYQTSMCRQTCGIFALNWPFRCDKDTFLQYVCETPLVRTIANKYIYSNGVNSIVAIACYSGYNQEDSLVISQGASDRGFFDGSKFTFYKSELEQKEEFGNPDITTTTDIKAGSYSKLKDGIISIGTKINKGDAIIGKFMRIPKTADSETTMSDRSQIYKENEEGIVHNVIVNRNESDERFCKIALRKVRPVAVGDKFSMKGTSEVLTDKGWIQIQYLDLNHKVATLKPGGFLDYVKPSGLSVYNYMGDMYNLETPDLKMCVTKNHKLYVKLNNQYELLRTNKVFGKSASFKKSAINSWPYREWHIADKNGDAKKYEMDNWLKLIGVFINAGFINDSNTKQICLSYNMYKLRNYYINILDSLSIDYIKRNKTIIVSGNKYPDVFNELYQIYNNDDKIIPDYAWELSEAQSRILLNDISIECDYDLSSNSYKMTHSIYCTNNIKLANDICRLALHAGWSGIIKLSQYSNLFETGLMRVIILKTGNEPKINNGNEQTEQYEYFEGLVYCLEIPDTHLHVYYSRDSEFSPPCWTGNSSRHGQKGICGILLRDSDMPMTEDGMRPEIIINPHAIPSRMTIGQLYESQLGNYCAMKGTHTDATIFKYVDIETIGNELETMGMDRYGYHRLYSGITGEFIDCLIFMGPTYYQRLQKFVIDAVYSISSGPSDALTRQPLDGKASGGGIRIGEMERDVICSHGSSKFLQEKFFDHSDGFTEYICRCGKAAVVNVSKNIYKCKYCGDNADIAAVPTSWSSKLFIQEMETMNVGVRRHLTPFTYESIREDIVKEMINT